MVKKGAQKLISFTLLFLGILLIGGANMGQAYTMMGDVSSYEKDGYNVTFNCQNGKVRLSFLREDLVKVHMAPAGKEFTKDGLHCDNLNASRLLADKSRPVHSRTAHW
ncbi:MAG: hypothetical protein ACYS21_11000 [Planctomycetota bacterium]